jgi:hypothetical protein
MEDGGMLKSVKELSDTDRAKVETIKAQLEAIKQQVRAMDLLCNADDTWSMPIYELEMYLEGEDDVAS